MNLGAYIYKTRMMWCRLWTTAYNKVCFVLNGVKYGRNFHSVGMLFVRNAGVISLGDNVNINSCARSNPVGGIKTTLFTCVGASIKVGNNVGMSNVTIYSRERVTIEDNVVIGAGSKIFDTDFHSVVADFRLNGNTNVSFAPVTLKEGCFVGADCIILKGVTIGREAVVGAGSVVTKSIPDGQIWAGCPARHIQDVPITQ